jgi:hypothetical protein
MTKKPEQSGTQKKIQQKPKKQNTERGRKTETSWRISRA